MSDVWTGPAVRSDAHRAAVDIYIENTVSEWHLASRLARLLTDVGYRVAPAALLDRDAPAGREFALADARAVIVIWPLRQEMYPKPALAAREAARLGRLVQVYAGLQRPAPDQAVPGEAPVDLSTWDLNAAGPLWSMLLRRLRPLCGPPPAKPRLDPVTATQTAVLCATMGVAVAGAMFALGQSGQHTARTTPTPTPLDPQNEAPAVLAQQAPAQSLADAKASIESAQGGPEAYDDDLGYEVGPAPREEAAAPPPRAPQGPEL